jgi:RNA polymerase sigma factor (sigma-70 family)
MSDSVNTERLDPILLDFLNSKSESEETELDQILSTHVIPLVKKILNRDFGSLVNANKEDREDLYSEAITRILIRLRDLKDVSGARNIESLEDYVAVTTHNVWNTFLRRRFPERLRIKNRIRYVLTNVKEFALWKNARSLWFCGMHGWQSAIPANKTEVLDKLNENQDFFRALQKIKHPTEAGLPDLLKKIFLLAGQPLEMEELVRFVIKISGSFEHKVEAEINPDQAPIFRVMSNQNRSQLSRLESRNFLQRIWEQIKELPQLQRIALLLHLRDEDGNDVISLFHSARVATIRQIASEVAMEPEQLAGMWKELPMDDHQIAAHLSMTRQQIINLRKSARERLTRRIKSLQATR